jgi:hypothetical protein
MASTIHRLRPDGTDDGWSDEPLPLGLGRNDQWPSRPTGRRRSRGPLRFLITFGIGVAATLGWQSYGDAAREMLASSSPVLQWVAPQSPPIVQVASDVPAAAPSPDAQQLKSISLDLAAVRQSVDQLAAQNQQMAAQNQQMAGAVATLQAAQQSILRKVSAPPPANRGGVAQ